MGEYLEERKKIHKEALYFSQTMGNETFRELNTQLIFIAAAILSFSLLIFLNEEITNQLNNCEKYILMLTWFLLGLSVISGIIHFFIEYYFFRKHFNKGRFVLDKLYNDNYIKKIKKEKGKEINKINKDEDHIVYNKIKEEALKKYPNVLPDSTKIFIIAQVFLLIASLALLIYFMIGILF